MAHPGTLGALPLSRSLSRIPFAMQLVIAAGCGLVVALVTYVVVSPGSDEYEARARGALTEEVTAMPA